MFQLLEIWRVARANTSARAVAVKENLGSVSGLVFAHAEAWCAFEHHEYFLLGEWSIWFGSRPSGKRWYVVRSGSVP